MTNSDETMEFSMHPIERAFSADGVCRLPQEKIDTIVVSNLVDLGRLTALRFIHWVMHHPDGVVSLPTGKTPQFFIEWVKYYRRNWASEREALLEYGFTQDEVDSGFSCGDLRFVQIDEFFPMNPARTNSFKHYIETFYFKEFGIREERALMLDPQSDLDIDVDALFPHDRVDFMLQFIDEQSLSPLERRQKSFLLELNRYCDDYERRIRRWGGIGFFLGGIGPDGHIGFNVRGSSFFSTTRLCPVNYETQAASATDLGGIQRNKLVFTIGLNTIAQNPNAVAIIMAAGDAKAEIVRQAIEEVKHTNRPASVLHDLPNARFYLTPGAASRLESRARHILNDLENPNPELMHEHLCQTALLQRKRIGELTLDDLNSSEKTRVLSAKLGVTDDRHLVPLRKASMDRLETALQTGRAWPSDLRSLHTAPHHDDLILGIFPIIKRELQDTSSECFVSVLTSGFTSVTNRFFLDQLAHARQWLEGPKPDFKTFCRMPAASDCLGFLNGEANGDERSKTASRSARLVRELIAGFGLTAWSEVKGKAADIEAEIGASYPGKKDAAGIQLLKGALREFEEELTWAAHGMDVAHISHLRLGFYQGDIFNQDPSDADCDRVFRLLERIEPDVVSLALDPEGSGPDTHYKCLLAISAALGKYVSLHPEREVEVLGYRNVWNRFRPWEADAVFLLTPAEADDIDDTFKRYYFSQVEASFPSPDYNGPFSELSVQIWQHQKKELDLLLKDCSDLSDADGAVFVRLLSPEELVAYAEERRRATQGL